MLKESNSLLGIEHSTHEDGTVRNIKKKYRERRCKTQNNAELSSERHAVCTRHEIQEYIGADQIFRLGFTMQ